MDHLDRARSYLLAHGRPLERALFATLIDGAERQSALDELATYQNPDGGFAHGLEPDLQTPASSAITTTVALQWLLRLGESDGLVARAARFLTGEYLPDFRAWQIVPPAVADAPHAPWWNYTGDVQRMGANPRAEILGYMYVWPQHFPEDMREEVTVAVLQQLEFEGEDIEMHDLLCYLRLAASPVPAEARERLLEVLTPLTEAALEASSGLGYGLRLVDVAPSPEAPLADHFAAGLPDALAELAAAQEEDGAWSPSWAWSSQPDPGWDAARPQWRSVLTLNNALILREHGWN